MGTRGLTGFIVDGTVKMAYQQFDSYFTGVGMQVLGFCRDVTDWEAVRQQVRALVVVDESGEPTPEQLVVLNGRWHQHVSSGRDWYAHLRGTHGQPGLILASGFIADPGERTVYDASEDSWIAYSYVVDLNKNEFRAYRGTLAGPLMGAWALASLPTDEDFLALDKD